MNRKQFRRKDGFGLVRNSLAFTLGAILMAAPATGWAGADVKGDFQSDSTEKIDSTQYESLAEAIDALNSLALEGWEGDGSGAVNDMNPTIYITGDEDVQGEEGVGTALKLDGANEDGDIKGFNNITIEGGGYSLDGKNSGTGTMLYIANASGDIKISDLKFLNGDAKEGDLDPETTTYDATGLVIKPNEATSPWSGFNSVALTNVLIQNNHGTIAGGGSSAGGGMTVFNGGSGVLTMIDFDLVKNTSETSNGIHRLGEANAFGGGAGLANLGTIVYQGGLVYGNQALSTGGLAAGGGGLHVSNAGPYGPYTAAFEGVEFSGNTARISSSGAPGDPVLALGGAYYGESNNGGAGSTASFSAGSSFSGNQAVAIGAYAEALGGGAAFTGNSDASFDGVDFTGNTADATLGTAAYGGAVYTQSSASFVNSSFTGNSAAGATAHGGAIFMDASVNTGGAESILDMTVEAGQTVLISGNTAGGQASGVYFGNAAADDSQKDGVFNILNEGRMEIRDPLTVALNNGQSFALKVEGEGSLLLDGENIISAEGGTELSFSQGAMEVTKDFSLAVVNQPASNFVMNIEQARTGQNTFIFDSRRESAMIDLTGAGDNKSFLVDAAMMTIDISDTRRQLVDDDQRTVLIVAGAGDGADYLADQFNTQQFGDRLQGSSFVASGGNVVLELDYTSPYTEALNRAGRNTASGAPALTALLQYDEITEEMLDFIHANYGALTPEYGLVAGTMGLNVNQFVSRLAVRQGLKVQHQSALPTSLSAQPSFGGAHEGARVWGGYAGNFRKVDNSGGYYGYDQDTSAALVGISYDLGSTATVGIFGGYSNNKADLNTISSEVESDGTHLGLLARLSPGPAAAPNLAIYLDASYSRYENDAYRRLGSEKVTGNFDQTAYTAGLGVEYVVPVSYEVLLTPSLDLRYTKLEQDSYWESGLTANHVKGYDVNSFTSALALTVSQEIAIDGGVITPSARLGWNHEYGDTEIKTSAHYLNPTGGLMPASYKLGTVERNRDSLDAGVGVRALFNSGSDHEVGLNVSYDVNISKDSVSHSVYGGLEYRF